MKQSNSCDELCAVIDVGSNTLRLLIGSVKDNKVIRIASSRYMTRLGKDILKTSQLNNDNFQKSISFLIEFKHIYEGYGVRKVIAVGTSALRESKNSVDFIKEVKRQVGINIEIISGEREADLTLNGIRLNLDIGPSGLTNFFMIDIGGGSTEWILFGEDIFKGSLPLGAVKAYGEFIKEDPPGRVQIAQVKEFIYQIIYESPLIGYFNKQSCWQNTKFVSTGGTPTTLAAIDMGLAEYNGDKVNMHRIERPTLQKFIQRFISMSLLERQKIIGLEPDRADIIITGALILQGFMEIFNFNEAIISDYGLLEGLLLEA